MYSQVSDNESGLEAWLVPDYSEDTDASKCERDVGREHGGVHCKMNVQSGTSGWIEGKL
jgi:hypothetical protein